MSDYRNRRSPYEQGELKGSPDRHAKKKKSKKSKKKSHQLPPEAKPYIHKADDDDDVQIIEAAGHGEEEGGSLTIKPPQTRPDKAHKHKKDKHKSREFIGDYGRDRYYHDNKPDRLKEHDAPRDFRDAREIVRERKKERELKEKEEARELTRREARKREESIKERERLERMELERRRERQVREDRHIDDKELRQQKRKDDRRNILDNKKERGRNEESHSDDHHRSRSRDQQKTKEKSRLPGLSKGQQDDRGPGKKEASHSTADRPGKTVGDRDEQDTRRVVVDDSDDGGERRKTKTKRKDYDDDVIVVDEKDVESSKSRESKSGADTKQEKHHRGEVDETGDAEEESEDDSESSEDSDSDSSSDDEDSSEEEEEDDEEDVEEADRDSERRGSDRVVDRTDDGRGKVRSKFDDHSDADTPERGFDQNKSDDNYLPESPEMSDIEENLEDNLPLYLPAIQGCRSVEEFNCLNRIEEGTYGVVYRARDKKTNEIVALKRLKMEKEKEGFPITSLREVNTLLKSQHENIVTVREIVVGSNMDKIYIVMDFVEHDLKSLMENMKNPFLVGEVKTLLKQLLRAVRHMHDNWILHRDLKTSNLLLSHKGILKVGDFGLAREYGSPLRNYTPVVVTLWYRSPELLLGCKKYSTLVDMWSVGCIFAELLLMKALWPGKSEIDQINRIFKDLGTPTEKIWPGVVDLPGMKKVNFNDNPFNVLRNRFGGSYFTDCGFDLLNRFFAYDPLKRITAEDALVHEYFGESPLPVDPSMFPTWPARSEQTKKTANSPKPPSGGKAYQKLMDDEENLTTAGGFHMGSAAKGVSAQGMGFSLKF